MAQAKVLVEGCGWTQGRVTAWRQSYKAALPEGVGLGALYVYPVCGG